MSKRSCATLVVMFLALLGILAAIAQGELAPGPLLDKRTQILNYLTKAKNAGIGVKPYSDALESIENDVKAGKGEEEIKPQVDRLVSSLSQQVSNLKSLKAADATKAAPPLSALPKGGFPASGFVGPNGDDPLAGLNPQYAQYMRVRGRAIPESMMESLLFDLTNKHRRENKLKPYQYNSKLASLARGHARDMVARNFFSHYDRDHIGPLERAAAAGYDGAIQENIGMAGAGRGTPIGMVVLVDDGLMKSPGHRAAILNVKGVSGGVGVCYDTKNGGIKACQVFSPSD